MDSFGIYNKDCIIVYYPQTSPKLIPSNAPYDYLLSDEDLDAINYHISNSKLRKLFVSLYDVHGKQYKRKMDMSWYRMILDIRDDMGVV